MIRLLNATGDLQARMVADRYGWKALQSQERTMVVLLIQFGHFDLQSAR